MGKGSAPRPIPDPKKFEENWDRVFKKNNEQSKSTDKKKIS